MSDLTLPPGGLTTPVTTLENDQALLDRVLLPYKEHCRYLTSALVERDGHGNLTLRGRFEIPESCYIASTGHFNAVEFNICYNQMAYYLLAAAVRHSLVEPFGSWSMAEYWERQLPNVLIADFRSRFRRPMESTSFSGSLTFTKISQRSGDRPLVVVDTVCAYGDDSGDCSDGNVKLAITCPPARD
ncbi:FcoT family thioesterase [Streptomyces sp. NPDC055607]